MTAKPTARKAPATRGAGRSSGRGSERGAEHTAGRGAGRAGGRAGRAAGTLTRKGEETRRALLDAAARLFAEHGYHETSVPDIVQAAGVGHGTFYEYFGSRRDILLALTRPIVEARQRLPSLKSQNLADRIRAEIYWYLSDHVEHLELSKVWHAASNFDPEIAETRRRERARRVARVRKGIESAADARPDIDPDIAAAALVAMLEEFTHRWFIEGDGPGQGAHDVVAAAETLGTLWLSAIGLEPR
ncbi:MAG TPA: helix-turn-helix domain-containing protein [Acidimicrobiales bacterium]